MDDILAGKGPNGVTLTKYKEALSAGKPSPSQSSPNLPPKSQEQMEILNDPQQAVKAIREYMNKSNVTFGSDSLKEYASMAAYALQAHIAAIPNDSELVKSGGEWYKFGLGKERTRLQISDTDIKLQKQVENLIDQLGEKEPDKKIVNAALTEISAKVKTPMMNRNLAKSLREFNKSGIGEDFKQLADTRVKLSQSKQEELLQIGGTIDKINSITDTIDARHNKNKKEALGSQIIGGASILGGLLMTVIPIFSAGRHALMAGSGVLQSFAGLPIIGIVFMCCGFLQMCYGFYKGSESKAQKKMDDILLTSLDQLEHDLLKTQELKEKATKVAEKGVITGKELVEQAQVSQQIDKLLELSVDYGRNVQTEVIKELALYLNDKIQQCSWLKDLKEDDITQKLITGKDDPKIADVKAIANLVKDKASEGVALSTLRQDGKAITSPVTPNKIDDSRELTRSNGG